MPINPNAAGTVSEPSEASWTSKDCLIYALGVGAGQLDATGAELEFTTENSQDVVQRVIPTFPVTVGGGGGAFGSIGDFNPAMLVHGEQAITLHGPLPVEGKVSVTGKIVGVYDKGSGAVVASESVATDVASGAALYTLRSSVFIRGEGGFGGDRGPSGRIEAPAGAPDHEVTYSTRPDQALLYRLAGDRNPLHSDPKFAALAGFDRPILHGLCTYGFTGRALLHTLCGSDPDRFTSMAARFSQPVFPGQALTVRMWKTGAGSAYFQTVNPAGDVVVDAGQFTYQA